MMLRNTAPSNRSCDGVQVPRRLRTRRDLLTLLAGAAELAVCPGCTDRGAWEQLAGDADALYAPDGATIVARVETNW
jgi:hypothetical protein